MRLVIIGRSAFGKGILAAFGRTIFLMSGTHDHFEIAFWVNRIE
jgi:hypothetical protein